MPPPTDDIATAVPHAADLHASPARSGVNHPIWPEAIIAFALGLNAAWVILLGYGLVKLVELAI
jgi:hypothetical protein